MTLQRANRIEDLFNDALELAPPDRYAFLRRRCGDDKKLLRELESLLDAHQAAHDFLSAPAAHLEVTDHDAGDLPAPVGMIIGRYRLTRVVASGGMGTVYESERVSAEFDQKVALKLLRRGIFGPDMRRRFQAERQTLANLEHPFITRLIDGGTTQDGLPYLVMEYVDGEPIDRHCDQRRLSVRDRLVLFRKVCEAVQFSHQNLVVHRDLKPGNILVTNDGNPKLVDFGIAKLLDDADGAGDATVTSLPALTPRYASPEQVRHQTTNTLSDVYSLGVILYELLTGHRPYAFDNRSDAQKERIVCEHEPATPSVVVQRNEHIVASGTAAAMSPAIVGELRGEDLAQLQRRLRGDLDNVVLKALHKDPARRYRSVEQFSEDIGRYLSGLPVVARKDTLGYRTAKLIKRNKPVFVAVSCLALALVLGVIGTTSGWIRASEARARAQLERNAALAAQSDAQAVTAYMQRIFSAANPYRRGRNATVAELLADAETRLEREMTGKPIVEAGVRFAIAHTYAGMWEWPDAARNLRVALKLYRQTQGPNSANVASCLTLLGRALTFAREPESVELQTQAVVLRAELFGNDDPRTAEAKGNLGYALWHGLAERRYDEAEPFYREAIGVLHGAPDEYRTDEARFTFSLAVMLCAQGRFDESEPLFRGALAIYRDLPKREDRYEVECMKKFAQLLLRLNKYDEAESLLVDSLAASPPGGGGTDMHTTLWLLGRYRLAADDPAGASRAILRSLSRACVDAAVDHPKCGERLEEFARALDPARTTPLEERPVLPAVTLLDDLAWAPSYQLDRRIFDLATCLQRTGRPIHAASVLGTHLGEVEAHHSENTARAAAVRTHLGKILADAGERDEALRLLSGALPILRAAAETYQEEATVARDTLSDIPSAEPTAAIAPRRINSAQ